MHDIRMITRENIESKDLGRLEDLARSAVRQIQGDPHLLPTKKREIIDDFKAGNAMFAIDHRWTSRFVGYTGFVPRMEGDIETGLGLEKLGIPRMSERYVVVLAQAYRGQGIGPEMVYAAKPECLSARNSFDVLITEIGRMVGTLYRASQMMMERDGLMGKYVALPGSELPYLHLLETHIDPAQYTEDMVERIEGTNPKYRIPAVELKQINDYLSGRSKVHLPDALTNAMYFFNPGLAYEADAALAEHFNSVDDFRNELRRISYSV